MESGKRLIIGVSGASGSSLALDMLNELNCHHKEIETHLIISKAAKTTLKYERPDVSMEHIRSLVDFVWAENEMDAPFSSGSFKTMGMVIVPCSMKTVAGICSGYSDNLILRAADVMIKEKRPLVLVARESPLSPIHLKNLYELSHLGVVVLPPMMTFYVGDNSIDQMIRQITGRILSVFGIESHGFKRWRD